MKEVGILLKVGQAGAENIPALGNSLRKLGVDTAALDREADKLGADLHATGEKTDELTAATTRLAGGSKTAREQLSQVKLELAAAGAAIYGVQRVLGDAARAKSEFDTRMAEVSTLLDNTSQVGALTEGVRGLAREYGGSAPEQARALYQIISAGTTDAAKATGLLDAANKLAIGGVTDIKTAADGLTSVLNAYGPAAGTATEVSDALFVAMKAGKTTVGELSAGIGQVAPLAAQAGVGLGELLAGTAALTKGGTSTSQSLTELRGIISAVINPSKEAAEIAAALGLQFDAQALKAKGLAGFLEDVRAKTGGNTEVMAKLFGSVEALGGALALTGNQSKDFGVILAGMNDRVGATDAAFAKMAETPGFAAGKMKSAMADLQLSLGQAMTALTPVVEAVTKAVDAFNGLDAPVRNTAAGVAAVTLAAVPAVLAVSSVTKAIAAAAEIMLVARAAAATTAVPLAEAAAGMGALGAASAAATPAIGGAAVATTALARSVNVLKSATGIGLAVWAADTVLGLSKVEDGAKKADKAVDVLTDARPTPGVVAAAGEASTALNTTTVAAKGLQTGLAAQKSAALVAAQALGVDMVAASKDVSVEFKKNKGNLDALIDGLPQLSAAGVDTGKVVSDALTKMVEGAKNQADLDALRQRIQEIGKAGLVSKDEVQELMTLLGSKSDQQKQGINSLTEAYKYFGISTQAELKKVADTASQAWAQVSKDDKASLEVKQAAFTKYAEAAIAANGGVVEGTIQAEAHALKLSIEFDKTGKAVVKAMGAGKEAVKDLAEQTRALNAEFERQRSVLDANIAYWNALRDAERQAFEASRLNGKTASAGTTSASGTKYNNDGFATNSDGSVMTASSGNAVPPDSSGAWQYSIDPYVWTVKGVDDRGNPVPGGWYKARSGGSGLTGSSSGRGLAQMGSGGTGGPSGLVAATPAAAQQQSASAQQQQVAVARQQAAVAQQQAAAQTGNYTVNVNISGKNYSIGAASQSAADLAVSALEAAYAAGGGG